MSLNDLCKIANFSKFHFHRQFSDYTGITVRRFIQLMRLKRASYRLAFDKSEKIIDIALDAQFENPESFLVHLKTHLDKLPLNLEENQTGLNGIPEFNYKNQIMREIRTWILK